MANITKLEFSFNKLPVWRNVQDIPGHIEYMDFSLGWDKKGFICQTSPSDVLKKIYLIYSDDKYNFITQPPGATTWANRLGDEKIDFINRVYGDLKGKTVLEIGAGSLYIAKRLTIENSINKYVIIDPAIKGVSKQKNIKILREYFTGSTHIDEKVDLIISLNCLEHVVDPVGFLKNIYKILSVAGGKGVLVFPDNEQQFKNGDFNAILHEHINYFTKDIAIELLNNCGLNTLVCETEYDTLKLLVEPQAPKSQSFIDVSNDRHTFFLNAIHRFNTNMEDFKKYFQSILTSGKKVAFHGANNGLNNIIALADLPDTSLMWIFDGDESKTGKYIPSCMNPIRHSSDPYYSQMNEVFISATTYFQEIRQYLVTHHNFDISHIHPLFPFEKLKKEQ